MNSEAASFPAPRFNVPTTTYQFGNTQRSTVANIHSQRSSTSTPSSTFDDKSSRSDLQSPDFLAFSSSDVGWGEDLDGDEDDFDLPVDDVWVHAMIAEIQKRPVLWRADFALSGTSQSLLKLNAWKEVLEQIEERTGIEKTVEVLQQRWKSITDQRARKRRRKPTGSAGGTKKAWKWEAATAFLDGVNMHRKTSSNLSVATSTNSAASTSANEASSVTRKRKHDEEKFGDFMSVATDYISRPCQDAPMSQEELYGSLVASVLKSLPTGEERRKQAATELMKWIEKYQ